VINVSRARHTSGLSPLRLDFTIGRLILLVLKIGYLNFTPQYYLLSATSLLMKMYLKKGTLVN
jgi:hypothetical protein